MRAEGYGHSGVALPRWERYQRELSWKKTNDVILHSIIGINTVLFLAFFRASRPGAARLSRFLERHFIGDTKNLAKGRIHCLLTSTFSHMTFFHYAANTYATYMILSQTGMFMTPTQTVGTYTIAGVGAAAAEIGFMRLMGIPAAVVGGSGSLLAFVGITAFTYPKSQWGIIFLPYYTSATNLLKGLIGLDIFATTLLFLNKKWKSPIAHRAHLTGLGIGYISYHTFIKHNQK